MIEMTALLRTSGQSGMLPGSVSAGGIIFTSGIVAASALASIGTERRIPVADQISGAIAALLEVLADAGSDTAHVLRIEAFLASADDLPTWNAAFLDLWPTPGPARTTLIAGFTSPAIAFELQATAVPA
jgi:enamine deaminase RidA (YjgF/YER057c/UK114 family)